MNGTKNVADPVTGIYRIYSVALANRPQAPKPNLSSLPGPSGLSDAIGLTKSILNTDANREVRNMTDLKPKSNLKRNLSIPNIKSLDKDMAMANLLSDTSNSGNYFGFDLRVSQPSNRMAPSQNPVAQANSSARRCPVHYRPVPLATIANGCQ